LTIHQRLADEAAIIVFYDGIICTIARIAMEPAQENAPVCQFLLPKIPAKLIL
jgi:hypothetical protein